MNPSAVSSVNLNGVHTNSGSIRGPQSAPPPPPLTHANSEELIRVFNTAIVGTQTGAAPRDFSNEIFELMENPAFRAILGAVRQFARAQGVSERQAAEQIITTFRKMDRVWTDYVFHEGVERLKGSS